VAVSSRIACGCVAIVAVAACYPEFSFLEPDGSGGSGAGDGPASSSARVAVGVGGASSSMEASSSTSMPGSTSSTGNPQSSATSTSTGSMMPVVPQVSCGPPMYVSGNWELSPCEGGQACCFDKLTPLGDHCSGSCDPDDFYTFTCDGPQDCEAGYMCCANVSGSTVTSTGCVLGCVSPNIVLCETTADCPSGTCQITFGDEGYDEAYLGCQ